jgi:hypothetical protein
MKKFIISEEDKKHIMGLYEQTIPISNPKFLDGSIEVISWNDATINKLPKWDGFWGIRYYEDLGIKIINHYEGKQSESLRQNPNFNDKNQISFKFNIVKPSSEKGSINFTISKDGKVLSTSDNINFGGNGERSTMINMISMSCILPKPIQGNYVISNSLDSQTYYLEIIPNPN